MRFRGEPGGLHQRPLRQEEVAAGGSGAVYGFVDRSGASPQYHRVRARALVGGLAIGLASTLSPLYIAEISPARIRGLLVSVNQLAIVTGILLSYSVNYGLTGAGPANWRWMFASAAVPSAFFLLTLLSVPESPRWLVQKGRETEAEHILSRIKGRDTARVEILAIHSAVAEESGNVLDPAFRKPLVVAVLIALFSQFTGINTIIYYGSLVFLEHVPNQTASTALWANVMIGVINFAATILGMYLIDRVGRKPLMTSAFAGMAVSLVGWLRRFISRPSPRSFALGLDLCRLLRHWHRHGNVGVDVRNLPEPSAGTRHVDRDPVSLVRDPARYAHFSLVGASVDRARRLPALRGHLYCGGPVCQAGSSGNQRTQP
jgi:hypothetical protein